MPGGRQLAVVPDIDGKLALQLLAAAVAAHAILGRLAKSRYRPSAAELAPIAQWAAEEYPLESRALVVAAEPLTKIWVLLEKLEQLRRSKKGA